MLHRVVNGHKFHKMGQLTLHNCAFMSDLCQHITKHSSIWYCWPWYYIKVIAKQQIEAKAYVDSLQNIQPRPHERGTDAELCVFFPPVYAAQAQVCPDVQFCANIVALLARVAIFAFLKRNCRNLAFFEGSWLMNFWFGF